MRFQKQKSAHIPQIGIEGDCYRTALACILDMNLDDVPHFMQLFKDDKDAVHPAAEEWLRQRGFSKLDIPYQVETEDKVLFTRGELLQIIAEQNGYDLLYMLTGLSRSNNEHVVICRGNTVLWDPSPDDSGVIAPTNGFYWVTYIMPSSMRLSYRELQYLLKEAVT